MVMGASEEREIRNRLHRAVFADPKIFLLQVLQIISVIIRDHHVHADHRNGHGDRESRSGLSLRRLLVFILVLRPGGKFAGGNEQREKERTQDKFSE